MHMPTFSCASYGEQASSLVGHSRYAGSSNLVREEVYGRRPQGTLWSMREGHLTEAGKVGEACPGKLSRGPLGGSWVI